MTHFYYSKGKQISLRPLGSAYVAQLPSDRALPVISGWQRVSLGTRGLAVFVRQEMMTERDDSVTPEKLVENLRNLGKIEPDREQRSSLDASLKQNSLGEALPVLVDESDHVFFPTGEVTLQLKRGISAEQLATIAQGHNFSVLRAIPYITNGFVVRAGSGEDGIELARVLVESGVATFAEPNLVAYLPHREVSYPRNSEFPKQWHLNNTGQLGTPPDVDISAIEAWDITTGSPYVCIAIIDSGVDLNHEAFAVPGKIVAPFDFEDTDNLPMPIDPHGTRCAGIAVAPLNRGKVVGVAPDCTLMPIRRATVSDHLKMADAFAWAADHGAAVISCSFGYDNKPWPQPEIVGRAVEYAATRGRNGKGCVIVWAAGNGNESISTDEWASNKNVIAVAALTDKNERAEYSDYGPEVDVCALSNGGVNGITTTTLGGYTDIFGGTSAAAPMVAGVAGLILSINPNLSSQEVRTLLCTSADKVDTALEHYDATTGHSTWYGYGRVNAYKALDAIDVLREAVRGDYKLEQSINKLTSLSDVLASSEDGKQIDAFLRQYKFSILHLLIRQPESRSQIQHCLRWVLTVSAAETTDPVPSEIVKMCRELVVQIVSVNRTKEGSSQQRQAQTLTNNHNKEGIAMSDNRELQSLVGKLKDVFTEATTSSTATEESPSATNEQSPAQTYMANGANVKVGDLVTEVMEAVNRSSPQLLKGRGGITIGMMIPPTVSPSDGIRLDDPYIPKTPIDKLGESLGGGMAKQLDVLASNAGALMSEMLTQRSAMTLPSTRRAEGLAKLRRLTVITEAESKELEKLGAIFKDNLPIPAEYPLLLKRASSSPVFKAIVSCALTAAEMGQSSFGGGKLLQEDENSWSRDRRPPAGGEYPHRPEPMEFLDNLPTSHDFDFDQSLSAAADLGGLVALGTGGNIGLAAVAAIAGGLYGGFFGGGGGHNKLPGSRKEEVGQSRR